MLVLKRKIGERVMLGRDGEAAVEVVGVADDSVRLGFEVPKDWRIHREEVYSAILANTKITDFSFTVPPKFACQHGFTDVTVTLDDGARWRATCCSYAALASQVEKQNHDARDNLCGRFFCLPAGILLVDDAAEASLEETIQYLLVEDSRQFQALFQRVAQT